MNVYLLRRYALFVISLFVNSLGIAFITKALLGTSPITSINYVLSMFTPLTMGQWTIIVNILFVLLELPLMTRQVLRADLRMYLLQIPISLCFGLFIDCAMGLLFWIHPGEYLSQIAYLAVGCVVLAAGIALEVKADAAMLSGEYFVKTIARRFRGEFGYVKLGFDCSLVALSCLISYCFMGGIYGVREGTVVAALVVGPIVRFLTPYCRFLDRWISAGEGNAPAVLAARREAGHVVITIAREYGSGGHLLGEMLAKDLGLKLYDKELIRLTAQQSHMDEDYIRANEQSIPSYWLKCIASENNSAQSLSRSISPDDVLFLAESKIIQEVSARESCVIVGRLADFVLRDDPMAIKVFCYSDFPSAYTRCVEEYGVDKDKAAAEIKRVNRNRIAHYEYYTGDKWADPHRYDLVINTGSIGLPAAAALVEDVYRAKLRSVNARS